MPVLVYSGRHSRNGSIHQESEYDRAKTVRAVERQWVRTGTMTGMGTGMGTEGRNALNAKMGREGHGGMESQ